MRSVYRLAMFTLQIIYASTSGHTEYVIEALQDFLESQKVDVRVKRAELATSEDMAAGDVLLLASGTWNASGIEGQLNPHMDALFQSRAKEVSLQGKKMAFIALGDDRYHYTARASEHLLRFAREHGGKMLLPPLIILNEPYDQLEKIRTWGKKLLDAMAAPKNAS